jgi:hypothetical protein
MVVFEKIISSHITISIMYTYRNIYLRVCTRTRAHSRVYTCKGCAVHAKQYIINSATSWGVKRFSFLAIDYAFRFGREQHSIPATAYTFIYFYYYLFLFFIFILFFMIDRFLVASPARAKCFEHTMNISLLQLHGLSKHFYVCRLISGKTKVKYLRSNIINGFYVYVYVVLGVFFIFNTLHWRYDGWNTFFTVWFRNRKHDSQFILFIYIKNIIHRSARIGYLILLTLV